MIHQTYGVVLNHIKYAETSVIVHIYTELFGRQSYMVNHVRSAKAKGKSVFLQPLALLELQVYKSPKKDIQRIKDFKIAKPFVSIPFEQTKRSVSFFVTEVLNRALHEEETNPDMFAYIYNSVANLDDNLSVPYIFHLSFLSKLTRYLGFFPDFTDDGTGRYFDLRNGHMCGVQPDHRHFLTNETIASWQMLFTDELQTAQLSPSLRNNLADVLLEYYALHLEGFGTIKSFEVLKDFYT